jgi:hypothetical protein|tara:strand:- start:135 stop:239 length:105 start_codon:yes stop_codon:yes gene_type:complete
MYGLGNAVFFLLKFAAYEASSQPSFEFVQKEVSA